MKDINIKEVIEDKTTNFNIKRFKHGDLKSEFPIKAIDLNNTTEEIVKKHFKSTEQLLIEKSKFIRKYDTIKEIIKTHNNTALNNFFGQYFWVTTYTSAITMTFGFNPFQHTKSLKEMEPFFDYLYSYSKDFVFVPNLKFKSGNNILIKLDDYIKYVDQVFNFLNNKNNKPIFVPISLKFSMADYDKLIKHYLKKENFYLWFDFEAQPVNPAINARIRRINSIVKDSGHFKKTLNFFTNVRREVMSNIKDSKSAASDVLASTAGANFIGVNREPQRFNPNSDVEPPKPEDVWIHKARIFDNKSYYYIKQDRARLKDKKDNITQNAQKLWEEFSQQTDYFLKNNQLNKYLETKDMFKEYPEILKSLSTKTKEISLSKFF